MAPGYAGEVLEDKPAKKARLEGLARRYARALVNIPRDDPNYHTKMNYTLLSLADDLAKSDPEMFNAKFGTMDVSDAMPKFMKWLTLQVKRVEKEDKRKK